MRPRTTKTALGSVLVLAALSAVSACSSTVTDAGGQPQNGAPISDLMGNRGLGGSGGQTLTVASGGSAGVTIVEHAGAGGIGAGGIGAGGVGAGGTGGIFVGECAAECIPQAQIRADFPAQLGAARQGTLTVCLNDQCYSSDLANIPDSAGVSIGPPCYVSVGRESDRATLLMSWMPDAPGSAGFNNGDRYRISVASAPTSAVVTVFDEIVDYTTVDYCNTRVCLEASIDARGSIGSGGEGGAE